MQIINSDILDTRYDVLWDDISPLVNNASAKPILVLVTLYEAGSAGEMQVKKMLDACKLQPEQYNIVKLGEQQIMPWHQLRDRLNPGIIFLIGISPAQLGISALFTINFPNNFSERIWLPTLSINELEKRAELKKQLWLNGMKPLFVDKPIPSCPTIGEVSVS